MESQTSCCTWGKCAMWMPFLFMIGGMIVMSIVGSMHTNSGGSEFTLSEVSDLDTDIQKIKVIEGETAELLQELEQQKSDNEVRIDKMEAHNHKITEGNNEAIEENTRAVEENNKAVEKNNESVKENEASKLDNEKLVEKYKNKAAAATEGDMLDADFFNGYADLFDGYADMHEDSILKLQDTNQSLQDANQSLQDANQLRQDANLERQDYLESEVAKINDIQNSLDTLIGDTQDTLNDLAETQNEKQGELNDAESRQSKLKLSHYEMWNMEGAGDLQLSRNASSFKTWYIITAIATVFSCFYTLYLHLQSGCCKKQKKYQLVETEAVQEGDEGDAAAVSHATLVPQKTTRELEEEGIKVVRRRLEALPGPTTPDLTLWQAAPVLVIVPLLSTYLAHRCIRMYRARKPVVRSIPSRRPSDVLLGFTAP